MFGKTWRCQHADNIPCVFLNHRLLDTRRRASFIIGSVLSFPNLNGNRDLLARLTLYQALELVTNRAYIVLEQAVNAARHVGAVFDVLQCRKHCVLQSA